MTSHNTRGMIASQADLASIDTSCREPNAEYIPLPLRSILPDLRVTFDVYVKTYRKKNDDILFLCFAANGEVFQQEWLTLLRQKGIDRLYFPKKDLEGVIAYLNNSLLCLDEMEGDDRSRLQLVYDHLHLTLHRLLSSSNVVENFPTVLHHVEDVLREFQEETLTISSLWEVMSTEYHLYHHSVNVFFITTAFLSSLKKDFHDLRLMGIAALLHDVGMLKVPVTILYQNRGLEPHERELLKKHPLFSYEMVQECPTVPHAARQLILEHHENRDGSGYPRGLQFWEQHPYTPILRLVDSYDALTSHRPYRPAFSAAAALKILMNQKTPSGHVFDQGLLRAFIRFLQVDGSHRLPARG